MLLYKQISDRNRIKYGTEAEKILKIIINQYSDRTHFIYEIIQNAEDACATYIKFHLKKDRLLIFHNGRLFNEKDVEGVCGIANGTKEDGTRIGHFGIGFKSVYCYTEEPVIHSGKYHFIIKNQLFPCETDTLYKIDYDETCMILPFNKKDVSSEIAYKEIKNALLKKIHAESILMLHTISDIKIEIDEYPEVILINKAKYSFDKDIFCDKVFSLSLQTTIFNKQTTKERIADSDYLFFTDNKKESSAIVFKIDEKELKAVRNSKIYAFFPTAKESHQNFYIHAPFDTTPARDNFKEGAEYGKHNIALLQAIGNLIRFAFEWMRDHQYLSVSGFNAVFPVYKYEQDDILYCLYQNSIDIINKEIILPTNIPGEFKNIKEIVVANSGSIVDVFNDDDLRTLRHNYKLSWLAKEFSTEAFSELREFLNCNFQLETLEWKDLVTRIDSFYLKQKELSWIEKLFSKIENYCIGKASNEGAYIDVSRIPFVRTTRGDYICARDESGKLQVYLNNPDNALYKIESTFLNNESIRSFYQRALRIPEYNIEQEVINNILPKYTSRDVQFKTENPIQENIEDLKIIKDVMYMNQSIIEQLKNKYIVTDGNFWYQPKELYLKSDDLRTGYSLVEGIVQIRYLADSYFNGIWSNLKLNEDFFKKLGCHSGICEVKTSEVDYLRAVRKYIGSQEEVSLRNGIFRKTYISKKLNWGFNYEGFPEVFINMTKEKSLAIARFLNFNAMNFDIQGELVGAEDQHFSGKNVDSMIAYSMLGLQLCFEKWMYVIDDPIPHSPTEIEKENLLPEYKFAKRLLSILPFMKVKNALTELFDNIIKDKKDLELIKHYIKSPEQLAKIAKAMARSEAQAEARKEKTKSVKELLEKGDKEQTGISKESDFEVSSISEKGKQKREQNLDKELAASLDEYTYVARGLSFASRSSNSKERAFLEQEYSGHCQICLKQINKYNGEHYFEAINIIKFNNLPERLMKSEMYGWNSLCLCPNCAAEYNYCSKYISTIYAQVMELNVIPNSNDTININIEMPKGKYRKIRYSPRHFMALKEALKIFAEEE